MQISSFKVSLESTDFKCNSSTFSIPNAWFPFIFGLQSRTMRFWPEDLNHLHAVYGCNHLLMNAGIWSCRALKMIAKILVWTYGDPGWRRQIGCHIRTLGGSLAAAGWTICKRSNKWPIEANVQWIAVVQLFPFPIWMEFYWGEQYFVDDKSGITGQEREQLAFLK